MPKGHGFQDLTGRQFGHYSVISFAGSAKYGRPRWWCRCRCGRLRDVSASNLTQGTAKSCGCARAELREGTRSSQAARIDAFLALVAAAEEHVKKCGTCRGKGFIAENYECHPVLDGVRVMEVCAGLATQRHPCPACGEVRRAIANTINPQGVSRVEAQQTE